MKTRRPPPPAVAAGLKLVFIFVWFLHTVGIASAQPAITPGELTVGKIEIVGDQVNLVLQPSVFGRRYQLQSSETLEAGTWRNIGGVVIGDGGELVIPAPFVPESPKRFYRLALDGEVSIPEGFALIPAGIFQMGDQSAPRIGYDCEIPVHPIYVSAFYMAKHEVTKALWDEVRAWGLSHGYDDLSVGSMAGAIDTSKGPDHPVHHITWHDMVKWCNARSQMENLVPCYTLSGAVLKTGSDTPDCDWSANGYRLPTEAEWEKAARGGLSDRIFPAGNSITHAEANYFSSNICGSYDISPTRGYHPIYATGNKPHTSPVGSFTANGYGLHDMAGNVSEWCWDWFSSSYYAVSPGIDPRGPEAGDTAGRVLRGGSWADLASYCRTADRYSDVPLYAGSLMGFRVARGLAP